MTEPSLKTIGGCPNLPDSLLQLSRDLDRTNADEVTRGLRMPAHAQTLGLTVLRRALSEFYLPNRALDASSRTHLFRQGQIHWSDTGLARHQRVQTAAFLRRHFSKIWPIGLPVEFLDLGDGQMTLAAIDGLTKGETLIAGARLVDQNSPALELAQSRLADALSEPIRTLVCDFRASDVLAGSDRSTLAFASAALHELPADDRTDILRRLANQVGGIALVELSHNNDVAGPVERNFALKVGQFYERLIGDAYRTLEPRYRWPVIGVFLLDELLHIWCRNYQSRGNYHLTGERWDDALNQAGFDVLARRSSSFAGLETDYRLAISRGVSA
jgi:hypothetical protein